MTDTYLTWLAAAIAAMKADGDLTALVGQRIYSDVPDNPEFPYIAVTIQSTPFDTKTETGMDHTMQLSIFDRPQYKATSRVSSPKRIGDIRAALYNLFHRKQDDFASDGVSIILFTGVSPVFKEPDGLTWQCPMQFQVITN